MKRKVVKKPVKKPAKRTQRARRKKVAICVLLDASGSMGSVWAEQVSAHNAFVAELQRSLKGYLVSYHVATFNTKDGVVILRDETIASGAIAAREATPEWLTPLNNALEHGTEVLEEFAKTDKRFLILACDGPESGSDTTRGWVWERLRLIQKNKAQAVVVGYGINAAEIAADYGIASSISHAPGRAKEAWTALASSVVKAVIEGTNLSFTAKQRKEAKDIFHKEAA